MPLGTSSWQAAWTGDANDLRIRGADMTRSCRLAIVRSEERWSVAADQVFFSVQ
jgi:hypothetical protein